MGPKLTVVLLALSLLGSCAQKIEARSDANPDAHPGFNDSATPSSSCGVTAKYIDTTTITVYDDRGLETEIIQENPNGDIERTVIAWDDTGLVSEETMPDGQVVTRTYKQTDAGLRIMSVDGPGWRVAFDVDSIGNIVEAQETLDPDVPGDYRSFESGNGQIISVTTMPQDGVATTMDYVYSEGLLDHKDVVQYNGFVARTLYAWSDGKLRERTTTVLNPSGDLVTMSEPTTYEYKGDCDHVSDRWYLNGHPVLER